MNELEQYTQREERFSKLEGYYLACIRKKKQRTPYFEQISRFMNVKKSHQMGAFVVNFWSFSVSKSKGQLNKWVDQFWFFKVIGIIMILQKTSAVFRLQWAFSHMITEILKVKWRMLALLPCLFTVTKSTNFWALNQRQPISELKGTENSLKNKRSHLKGVFCFHVSSRWTFSTELAFHMLQDTLIRRFEANRANLSSPQSFSNPLIKKLNSLSANQSAKLALSKRSLYRWYLLKKRLKKKDLKRRKYFSSLLPRDGVWSFY